MFWRNLESSSMKDIWALNQIPAQVAEWSHGSNFEAQCLEAQKFGPSHCSALGAAVTARPPGGSGRLQGYEAVPGQRSKWGHDSCARSVSSPVEQGPRPQQAVSAHTRTAAWTDLQRLPDDPYCGPMHWKNTNG